MRRIWLQQSLCSLNLSVVIVSVCEVNGHSAFLGKLAYPADVLLFPLLRQVYRDESFQRSYSFAAMSLLLAVIIFIVVRLLSYLAPLRLPLLISIGLVSIAAYPVGCLWIRWLFLRISIVQASLLLLEVVAAAFVLILYYHRKWLIARGGSISMLGAHFALWAWASGMLGASLDFARAVGPWNLHFWAAASSALLPPVLGFFSTLAWSIFVRESPSTLEVSAA